MYDKILVPLDGLALAEKSLPVALRLASICKAGIVLLRVAKPQDVTQVEPYLNQIADLIRKYYPEIEVIEVCVGMGEAYQQILHSAREHRANIITMTTHSRNSLSRLLLGSVAARVIKNSPIPVILLHPKKGEEAMGLEEAMAKSVAYRLPKPRIAITLDGSPEAEAILEPTLDLARKINASVYLIRIVLPVVYNEFSGSWYLYDLEEQARIRREDAYDYLGKIQEKVVASGLDCIKVVRVGTPDEEIVNYINQTGPMLLAMATHARGAVGELVFGSVVAGVMHQASVPVFTVHSTKSNDLLEMDNTSFHMPAL
ncbi:MAG: universal stress protein [Chloroflexi bacterium]|uniref:Universal stress protein n=1 Tax=Candidatus Chlorohelix allophototropha TaxID=3003348 RepID=A0A8T7LUX5_9CHLR|nr:universal stress protein [Chloroflexota bacterium]WJW67703.1 universal stress protein [Chloroflexota bacterium L227-S17]